MTFATAWSLDDVVMVLADTAVTISGLGRSGPTSLGQAEQLDGVEVHEAVLKVFRCANDVLVTGAGSGEHIEGFARIFDECLRTSLSPSAAAARAGRAFINSHGSNVDVTVLVASRENDCPRRFLWSPANPNVLDGMGALHAIGSAPIWMKQALANAIERQAKRTSPLRFFLETNAFLFKRALSEPDLLRSGVGGPWAGGILSRDGFRWQPDIAYVVLTDEFFAQIEAEGFKVAPDWMLNVVASAVRDDIMMTFSTYLPRHRDQVAIRLFRNGFSPAFDPWMTYWQECMSQALFRPEVVIFLHPTRDNIVILPNARSVRSPITFTAPQYGVAMRPEFLAFLRARLMTPPTDATLITWCLR